MSATMERDASERITETDASGVVVDDDATVRASRMATEWRSRRPSAGMVSAGHLEQAAP